MEEDMLFQGSLDLSLVALIRPSFYTRPDYQHRVAIGGVSPNVSEVQGPFENIPMKFVLVPGVLCRVRV